MLCVTEVSVPVFELSPFNGTQLVKINHIRTYVIRQRCDYFNIQNSILNITHLLQSAAIDNAFTNLRYLAFFSPFKSLKNCTKWSSDFIFLIKIRLIKW